MNGLIDERPEIRSYAALEDMLELQRRMIETTREMSWLVQRCRTSPAPERPRLRRNSTRSRPFLPSMPSRSAKSRLATGTAPE